MTELFDWRGQGGGDDADVFAYLLDENTGNTIQLLDANAPRVGAAPWQSSDVTVMTPEIINMCSFRHI